MKLVFGLMLLQTAACLEFNCSFNPAGDSCYAALGHKLNLLMVDSHNYNLKLTKTINNNSDDRVCRVKKGTMRNCDLFNRTEVTVIDGTLIINPVIRADSGNYTLTLSDTQGVETYSYLQVIVEAPVTSVEVSIICSSSGGMEASCSSDGDQLVYSWTLNGDPLMDGNSSIQLNERTEGNISCSVKNNVNEQKNFSFKHCPGPTTASVTPHLNSSKPGSGHDKIFSSPGVYLTPSQSSGKFPPKMLLKISLIALCCVSLILVLLFIVAYYFYKRNQVKSTPAPAKDTELVYAQISHEEHKKNSEKKKHESVPAADVEYAVVVPQKKRKQRKEEEVQYGEVTFTPHQSNAHREPKEECLYSQVHRR